MIFFRQLHAAVVEHLGPLAGQLQHLVVSDLLQLDRAGGHAGIGGIHAVYVGVDLAQVRAEGGGQSAGGAKDTSIARIAVVGLDHNPGVAFRVFSLLGKAGINVDAIIQSIGRDTSKDISFTLPRADVEEAVRVLEDQKGALHFDHLTVEDIYMIFFRQLHAAVVEHLGSLAGQLQHLIIGDLVELPGAGDQPGVGGVHPIHVGVDLAQIRVEGGGPSGRWICS